jgi:ornithine carbamoyltransferase
MIHDLLRVADLSTDDFIALLETAAATKKDPASVRGVADGKAIAVLFEKPSLRTRFSVEAAAARLGAHPIGAYDREVGLGKRESIEDAAHVLERYVDALVMRTFEHSRVTDLADASSVPVINALSDDHHPLQALADMLTIAEARCDGDVRGLKGVKVAWVGDGNNVARSLIEACALVGAEISIATPEGYEPGGIDVVRDPFDAVSGADVVVTDTWASMGQEEEAEARKVIFEPFRVTKALMSEAALDAIFLHCLPAYRGQEVEADVIDGPKSRVFDEAENRLHTTLSVLLHVWGLA